MRSTKALKLELFSHAKFSQSKFKNEPSDIGSQRIWSTECLVTKT